MSEMDANTRPVAPQHAIDAQRLAGWMTKIIGPLGGPLEVAQFKGGQSNPTYLLRAGDRRFVLRRKPPGKLLPSARSTEIGAVPLGLAHDVKLIRPVKKGQSVTWADVEIDQSTRAYKLRKELEGMFAEPARKVA